MKAYPSNTTTTRSPDRGSHSNHRIALADKNNLVFVRESDIIRVQGAGSYCTVYLLGRDPITISHNLGSFAKKLASNDFCRVHQSHLIQLSCVMELEKGAAYRIHLIDGSSVPVARRKRDELLKKIHA